MTLLDVIVPGQPYRPPRRRWETIDSIQRASEDKVTDTVSTLPSGGQEIADTASAIPVNGDAVADSVNSSQMFPSFFDQLGAGGDDSSILLWAIVAVVFALAVCLYLVFMYRRMLYHRGNG